ncbi:MAG: hypothetical protein V7L00_26255 [Nostoc sp.]|uniref:hypothetical protein n=1 Tax=unclassified Nostoc TaxID=2593658 RepID=UPI0025F377DE|nr:hypothetical protein [Nostoc sp. JL33]
MASRVYFCKNLSYLGIFIAVNQRHPDVGGHPANLATAEIDRFFWGDNNIPGVNELEQLTRNSYT